MLVLLHWDLWDPLTNEINLYTVVENKGRGQVGQPPHFQYLNGIAPTQQKTISLIVWFYYFCKAQITILLNIQSLVFVVLLFCNLFISLLCFIRYILSLSQAFFFLLTHKCSGTQLWQPASNHTLQFCSHTVKTELKCSVAGWFVIASDSMLVY